MKLDALGRRERFAVNNHSGDSSARLMQRAIKLLQRRRTSNDSVRKTSSATGKQDSLRENPLTSFREGRPHARAGLLKVRRAGGGGLVYRNKGKTEAEGVAVQ